MNGVLVVDKPQGMTSHDVVQRVRRALDRGRVGHAGTLDPMATGVLVVAVGEGTKLVPYLSAEEKEYEAEVLLGVETDSLDADGAVRTRASVPSLSAEELTCACASFVGEIDQVPPAISAIKVDGIAAYRRTRRGEQLVLAPRRVRVFDLDATLRPPDRLRLRVRSGAGFYVRSLARDLARSLGTVGHLVALRRTKCGDFGLAQAISFAQIETAIANPSKRAELGRAFLDVSAAWGKAPRLVLTAEGVIDARHGKVIRGEHCAGEWPEGEGAVALLAETGHFVAIARRSGDEMRVIRGLHDG